MKSGETLTWEQAVQRLRDQPAQRDLVRACFFDDPLIDAARRYHASSEWRAVRALIPQMAGTALDLGAGRGISSYALAADGWKTTALEPDPSGLVGASAIRALATESGLDIHVVQEWGESLPFQDASFDVVHGRQVLHHARDLKRLCVEIGRVLKPGGIFIATREHVISRREDLDVFLRSHPLHFLYGGEHAYLLEEYIQAIWAGGIELLRAFNPLQSDINLFPETRQSIKALIARRLRWPFPAMIPDFLLGWGGTLLRTPGRLYTFLGRKPDHA